MVLGFSNSSAKSASQSTTEDSKVLILCRERKHFVRQILEGRCALAEAHEAYIHSLKNTGIAIRKLVAAEPPNESSLNTDMNSSSGRAQVDQMNSSRSMPNTAEERPPLALTATVISSLDESPRADASEKRGWDYFGIFHSMPDRNPIDNVSKSEDDPPELEEDKEPAKVSLTDSSFSSEEADTIEKRSDKDDGEKSTEEVLDQTARQIPSYIESKATTGNVFREENRQETKIESKDLILSVKDIELLFIRAAASGSEVPRMLEASTFNDNLISCDGSATRSKSPAFLSALLFCCKNEIPAVQDPPETQLKLDCNKSAPSISSSSRSPTCMNSGSHALTLDRLYAWERKLYDEVKANGFICRKYDAKCKLLKQQDLRGEKPIVVDKTRASVKDLHSRICVAIHRIDSISKRIEEIRDKELQPQLEELISALSGMWKTMVECHRLQHQIVVAAVSGSVANQKAFARAEHLRIAATTLQTELIRMNSSFNKWIGAHKIYLQAINNWLLKCVKRVKQRGRWKKDTEFPPRRATGPPIYVACNHWLAKLEELPTKETSEAMKRMVGETARIIPKEKKKKKDDEVAGDEETGGGGEVVDWGSCLVTVQRGLVDLLGKLEVFAETSETMYRSLGSEVEVARRRYEAQKAAMDLRNS